jgi:hypothetical protein
MLTASISLRKVADFKYLGTTVADEYYAEAEINRS